MWFKMHKDGGTSLRDIPSLYKCVYTYEIEFNLFHCFAKMIETEYGTLAKKIAKKKLFSAFLNLHSSKLLPKYLRKKCALMHDFNYT